MPTWRQDVSSNFLSPEDAANAEKAIEEEEKALSIGNYGNRLPIADYGDFGDAKPESRHLRLGGGGVPFGPRKAEKLIVKRPVIPFKAVPAVPGRPVIPEAEIAAVVIAQKERALAQRERSFGLRQSHSEELMYL